MHFFCDRLDEWRCSTRKERPILRINIWQQQSSNLILHNNNNNPLNDDCVPSVWARGRPWKQIDRWMDGATGSVERWMRMETGSGEEQEEMEEEEAGDGVPPSSSFLCVFFFPSSLTPDLLLLSILSASHLHNALAALLPSIAVKHSSHEIWFPFSTW